MGHLRIPCPAHGGTNPNLALWVNDGGIAARCHSAGCSYADIAAAILDRYGTSINRRGYQGSPSPAAASARRTPEPGPTGQDLRPHALRLWRHSVPISNSPDHPSPDVACPPPSMAPRAAPAGSSALDQRPTPAP